METKPYMTPEVPRGAPPIGTHVAITDPFEINPNLERVRCVVEEHFSSQFKARSLNGTRIMFEFYRNRNRSWEVVS